MRNKKSQKFIGIGLLAFYIITRFLFPAYVESVVDSGGYIIEVLVILVASLIFRDRISFRVRNPRQLFLDALVAIAAGFFMYFGLKTAGINNPLTFNNTEETLSRIFTASLLIELLFRHALFHPTEDLLKKHWPTTLVTAALTAYAFLGSIFYTHQQLHTFIYYQSSWMLLMGIWWGFRYFTTRSLTVPVTCHVAFNFGFYLGLILM